MIHPLTVSKYSSQRASPLLGAVAAAGLRARAVGTCTAKVIANAEHRASAQARISQPSAARCGEGALSPCFAGRVSPYAGGVTSWANSMARFTGRTLLFGSYRLRDHDGSVPLFLKSQLRVSPRIQQLPPHRSIDNTVKDSRTPADTITDWTVSAPQFC